jgi:hypothetical protein
VILEVANTSLSDIRDWYTIMTIPNRNAMRDRAPDCAGNAGNRPAHAAASGASCVKRCRNQGEHW